MDSKNILRPLTKDDLRMITPFLDVMGTKESKATEKTVFAVPDSLIMPLTAALSDPAQVELMLSLFNTEPHHTRLLAVRNAQDENMMIIPEAADVAKELRALREPQK